MQILQLPFATLRVAQDDSKDGARSLIAWTGDVMHRYRERPAGETMKESKKCVTSSPRRAPSEGNAAMSI